jgi:hypothetical protein
MDGTPESSRGIMSNFLKLAKEWNSRDLSNRPSTAK